MPFLSVIIPVYKVEKYLHQCVDSVINQSLDDLEIILVDDGSPDACPQICDEYAARYDYIKVIHKKNGGLSSARNAGIAATCGKYIIFMDSDDWWNHDVDVSEMLEAVKACPDIEMFLFTCLDYVEGVGYFKRAEHERLSAIRTDSVEHYYSDLLQNGNLEVHAATKVLKREFVLANELYFTQGIVGEDNEWMLRLLRVLKSVMVLNYPLYIYRAGRPGSITNSIGIKNVSDLLNIIKKSIDYYKCISNSLMQFEYCYCAYLWFCALGLSYKLIGTDFAKLAALFKETSVVCEYSNSGKTKLAYRVYKLLGLQLARFVLGVYINYKDVFSFNKKKQ